MGLFLTFDAVGLGVFTIIGATRINHGISLMVSADASGLQKGVICLNKFVGVLVYALLIYEGVSLEISSIICIIFVTLQNYGNTS